jgi:Ca-activated chloride channel family protein
MIEERRDQGIFLTVLGLGMGNYKDSRMESLADKGNGNYAYIDTVNEARKVLVTEMSSTMFTIAKDVKIQIEFNPVEVESYRLIGYENRVMAAQDFDDDRKDAGEIGAGHSVTALYEIIPAEGSVGASALRYQSSTVIDTAGNSGELAFIKFRYKKPDEDLSILTQYPVSAAYISYDSTSENFRFSAAVAEWGMLLRNSGFKADADINNVIKTVRGALGQDEYGYRAEFLSLLYKTRELIQ